MVQDNKAAYIASQYGQYQPPTGSTPGAAGGFIPPSNTTGTTGGQANPHTDTGFSGGQFLASGATNPGYSPPGPGSNPGPAGGPPPDDGSSGSNSSTGAGATGGTGTTSGPGGMGLATLAGINASKKFLGVNTGGIDTLINQNAETFGLTGDQNQMI